MIKNQQIFVSKIPLIFFSCVYDTKKYEFGRETILCISSTNLGSLHVFLFYDQKVMPCKQAVVMKTVQLFKVLCRQVAP